MRRLAFLTALLAVALTAPPVSAMCAMPGVWSESSAAEAGSVIRLHVLGGRGAQHCNDTFFPGRPRPPEKVIRVTVSMESRTERVDLRTFRQRGYGADVYVRIPADTAAGPWRLVTDTGLRATWLLQVTPPAPAPTLPRTGVPAPAIAAFGLWLVTSGGYAVAVARPVMRV